MIQNLKCDVTYALDLPPSVTNFHTFSPPSPSSVTYFMDGPIVPLSVLSLQQKISSINVTPAIRIRQRPGHPGSPGVLSANGSLHFGRYSEACNGRVERFLCQVQVYFRSY